MNLFLDVDGTLIESNFPFLYKEVLKDNIAYIKAIVGSEVVNSITLISYSLVSDVSFSHFMYDYGFIFPKIFGIDRERVSYIDTFSLKGDGKREMFLHASPNFGHSIFFDDSLKKPYEAFRNEIFEKELFKV